jgi:hypothetical protein
MRLILGMTGATEAVLGVRAARPRCTDASGDEPLGTGDASAKAVKFGDQRDRQAPSNEQRSPC